MIFGLVVAPEDLVLRIEHDHALRQRLRCAAQACERISQGVVLADMIALAAVELGKKVIPRARGRRQGLGTVAVGPAHKRCEIALVADPGKADPDRKKGRGGLD